MTTLSYQGHLQLANVVIPKIILLNDYNQRIDHGVPSSTLKRTLRLILDKKGIVGNPGPLTVESVVKTGTYISYGSSQGATGLLYDPANGSIHDQIRASLRISNLHRFEHKIDSPSNPWVFRGAIFLAVIFGVLAVYFLIKRPKGVG